MRTRPTVNFYHFYNRNYHFLSVPTNSYALSITPSYIHTYILTSPTCCAIEYEPSNWIVHEVQYSPSITYIYIYMYSLPSVKSASSYFPFPLMQHMYTQHTYWCRTAPHHLTIHLTMTRRLPWQPHRLHQIRLRQGPARRRLRKRNESRICSDGWMQRGSGMRGR